MSLGSVQTLVVCVPVEQVTGPEQQAVCPVVNGQNFAPANVKAYVIDPAHVASLEAQHAPFDYGKAAEIYGFAFVTVMGLYLTAKSVGVVVNMIKS
ncbi:hypothetical protein F2K45_24515 [Salmonella enterica subsp. enterica]|nr:hypothetical protein [Salmonella enterica subsp. enterica serovar Heidelberg]